MSFSRLSAVVLRTDFVCALAAFTLNPSDGARVWSGCLHPPNPPFVRGGKACGSSGGLHAVWQRGFAMRWIDRITGECGLHPPKPPLCKGGKGVRVVGRPSPLQGAGRNTGECGPSGCCAAVDYEDLAGDEGGFFGCEEEGQAGDVFGLAKRAMGCSFRKLWRDSRLPRMR